MPKLNEHYQNLKESYLFSDIAKRVNAFTAAHPDKKIIRMGIGDVTLPLMPEVVSALHGAVDEMAHAASFHGYGPEQGYDFLRGAIQGYYAGHGVSLDPDEIFVSDGAKSDVGNITDLFDVGNVVLIPDPVYPVYVDTNVMDGREVLYLNANAENGFLPMPNPDIHADLIYLCSPNNPTGAVYTLDQLKAWVAYALEHKAVILFDAAYEAFIGDDSLPRSIFAVEGAKKCAIEFCSLSKTAGFTGTRCAYTVVPRELTMRAPDGETLSLNRMWLRRQTTKFNGVSYIIQRGAAAVFSDRHEVVGVLRLPARKRRRRRHAGRGLRRQRRGVFPPHRIFQPGADRRSDGAVQDDPQIIRQCRKGRGTKAVPRPFFYVFTGRLPFRRAGRS